MTSSVFPDTLSKRIEASYPYPLASVYRKLRTTDPDLVGELHTLCGDLSEVMVKLVALASLQDFRATRPLPTYLESFLASMLHPSLGHFNELLRYIAAEDTDGMAFASLASAFYRAKMPPEIRTNAAQLQETLQTSMSMKTHKDLFDLLNVYRNKRRGHGAALSGEEYRDRVSALLPILLHLLEALSFLTDFEFVYVDEVRVTPTGEFLHKLKGATGLHPEPRQSVRSGQLTPEHFYLVTTKATGDDHDYIDLHPFVINHLCKDCRSDQVFFFNDYRKKRLEFLSYSCGHHLYPGMLPSEFEQLLKVSLRVADDEHDDGGSHDAQERSNQLLARALERISAKDYVYALDLLRASIGHSATVDNYYTAAMVAMAHAAPPTEVNFYISSAEQLAPQDVRVREARRQFSRVLSDIDQLRAPRAEQLEELQDLARSILEESVYLPEARPLLACVTPRRFRQHHVLFWGVVFASYLVMRAAAAEALGVEQQTSVQLLKLLFVVLIITTSAMLAASLRDVYFALFNRVTRKAQPTFPDFYRARLEESFGAFRTDGGLRERLNWNNPSSRRYLLLVLMSFTLLSVGGTWLTVADMASGATAITFVALDYLALSLLAAPAAPALFLSAGLFRAYSRLPLRAIVGAVGSASFNLVGRRMLAVSAVWTAGFVTLSFMGYLSFSDSIVWLQLTLYYATIYLGCLWTVGAPWSFSKALGIARDEALQDYSTHVEEAFRAFVAAPDEKTLERYDWLRDHQREVIKIRSSGLLPSTFVGSLLINVIILCFGIGYPIAKFNLATWDVVHGISAAFPFSR